LSKTNKTTILIIGGGIGGLSTALGLARLGKEVHVLEQAPEFKEVGAGIQLAPNALRVLDKLGVLEYVYDFSVFPRRNVAMCAITGRELSAIEYGDKFVKKFGYQYALMHRADLLSALVEACKDTGLVTMLTNHKVESIENDGDRVFVTCTNGLSYESEVVIGADGVKSKTREIIAGSEDEPVFSDYVAYRGTVPIEEIARDVNIKEDEKLTWIGPNIHLVQYALRRKEIFNQVAVFKTSKYQKGNENNDKWGTPEELDERFSTSCETVRRAVTFMHRQRRWPMFDRNPIYNWTQGRITLLGDAAHAMVQYLAQGACQSFEDADSIVEKFQMFGDNYEKALQAYQEERIPRATKVQGMARKMGDIIHAEDPTTILMRDYIMENRKPDDYSLMEYLYSPQK